MAEILITFVGGGGDLDMGDFGFFNVINYFFNYFCQTPL